MVKFIELTTVNKNNILINIDELVSIEQILETTMVKPWLPQHRSGCVLNKIMRRLKNFLRLTLTVLHKS